MESIGEHSQQCVGAHLVGLADNPNAQPLPACLVATSFTGAGSYDSTLALVQALTPAIAKLDATMLNITSHINDTSWLLIPQPGKQVATAESEAAATAAAATLRQLILSAADTNEVGGCMHRKMPHACYLTPTFALNHVLPAP